jgi:hypothetical protein
MLKVSSVFDPPSGFFVSSIFILLANDAKSIWPNVLTAGALDVLALPEGLLILIDKEFLETLLNLLELVILIDSTDSSSTHQYNQTAYLIFEICSY